MLSVHSCPGGRPGGRDTGGMNVYVRELARELGSRGHVVDIYTRAHDPAEAQVAGLGKGVRVIHLTAGEVENMHKLAVYSYLADFACGLEGFRKRHGLAYDLIHSHYWLSGWVGQKLQMWWNLPHITMFHTLGAVKNATAIGEDEPELRLQTEKEIALACDRIVAATELEKEQLIRYYDGRGESVTVIPCGVNLNLFRPMDRKAARERLAIDGSRIILFVGRIEPLKGLERLIRAVCHLRRACRLLLVVVGGDGQSESELQRLQKLIRDLDIQDAVRFAGIVNQEDLPDFYNAADVCVIPSYYESFGLVGLESLACGTPVVTTRVGGMESIVWRDEIGYLLAADSPSHLAGKVAKVLSTCPSSVSVAALARESVASFGWANVADAVLKEYEALLSGRVEAG
jgi:D-inositol-3-phosphate glycosyltransferase